MQNNMDLTANLEAPSGQEKLEADCRRMLAAIVRRDEAQFAAFYDATVSRVYGFALRITRQREAAEEVAEDVYLQVWQQAARFDAARGKVLTWLLTICRSRALDHLRRQDEADAHPDPELLREEIGEDGSDPQDILLALERDSKIHALLEELTPVQRQLIALAFFRGLTHQEIADHTAIPLGTVKTHVRRALEKLRPALQDADH
jgi:RNA polymerase sigma factor (sigma-70 family)